MFTFLVTINVFSQEECGTIIPDGVTLSQAQSGNLTLFKTTAITEPIRLAIHIVKYSDGTEGISQTDLNSKIGALNTSFEQVPLSFQIYSTDYIVDDQFAEISNLDDANALRQVNNINGAIDIYFVPYLGGLSGLSSFSSRVDYTQQNDGIVMWNDAHITTLPHEMGHYFDLFHPYESFFNPKDENGNIVEWENIENIDDCSNWSYTGDLLLDTPSDPSSRVDFSLFTDQCVYSPYPGKVVPVDNCGNDNYAPLADNLMHTEVKWCRTSFTSDQKARIMETLIQYRPELLRDNLVYLENSINGNNAGGKLYVDSEEFNSGEFAPVDDGTHIIRTENDRFVNYLISGDNYKHNNWNDDLLDAKVSRSKNVISDMSQIANFFKMNYSKIEVRLDNAIVAIKGNAQFLDPWYIQSDGSQTGSYWYNLYSQYEPNGKDGATEKGVFLGQAPDANNPSKPYYSVKTTSPQTINVQGKNRQFYFQNWETTGATLQNSNSLETPVVFNQAGATVKAVMKGVGLSSNNLAFDQNNQRKIVRTDNGNLHMVYESMGKIWYERSTDNGSTWTIMNNNQPLSSGNAKMPTIDFGFDNGVAIAYQQESDSYYTIQLKFFKLGVLLASKEVITGYYPYYYSSDAYPVVTYGYTPTNKLLVVWQMKSSNPSFGSSDLHYWIGEFNSSTNTIVENGSGAIANTDINSTKPSVVINRAAGYKEDYHLVWQQNGTSGSSVKYTKMVWDSQNENMIYSYYSEPSYNSGYASNFNPSIAITLNRPRVVWLTENPYTYILEGNLRTGNLSTWGTLTRFSYGSGYSVESINVNARNVDYGFVVGYAGDGQAVRYYKPSVNLVAQPTRYDNYVQLSNGVNYTDMAIQTFNTASAPYYFNSTTVDATLSKTSSANEAIKGREIVFNNGKSNLIFEVNNIKVDENAIDFVEIEDTTVTKSNEEAISLFETESFFLTDKSNFSFDVNYTLIDKENLEEQFGFEYQLVDANTNLAIGVLEKIETSKLDSEEESSVSYTINTEGIGNKQVKLKLVVAKDVADNVAIISTFSTKSDLAKSSNKVISFDETLSITDYALEQNYPNPFNPSTIIKYQIPNDGLVTMKIYDITGQEVKTLVNESQTKGRYEINFDASNLSTGVYFYRLTSGSFTKSMKMLLIK